MNICVRTYARRHAYAREQVSELTVKKKEKERAMYVCARVYIRDHDRDRDSEMCANDEQKEVRERERVESKFQVVYGVSSFCFPSRMVFQQKKHTHAFSLAYLPCLSNILALCNYVLRGISKRAKQKTN